MKIWSDSFRHGEPIPTKYAFGKHDPESHFALSDNHSPHLAWSDVPAGTKSLVLICHDPDAPTKPDQVNKEGMTVPADLPRADFYHWVLCELAADTKSLAEGVFSTEVTVKGKPGPEGPNGTRQGLNDYTGWFQGDANMEGRYFGYDGPAPPWNDELVHRYHFTIYAIDLDRVPLEGDLPGPKVLEAIQGHILGQATITGTYHIYPDAKAVAE